MKEVTPYQMCINNAKNHIMKHGSIEIDKESVDAFTFSTVIAICFCKAKEEVLVDLIK